MESDWYLSRHELARFPSVSARTIDRRVADGSLPPPILIGPPKGRKVRKWRLAIIIAQLEKRR
jgi:hypothetical protein